MTEEEAKERCKELTAEHPDRVTSSRGSGAIIEAGRLKVELPPRSWNVIRLEVPA